MCRVKKRGDQDKKREEDKQMVAGLASTWHCWSHFSPIFWDVLDRQNFGFLPRQALSTLSLLVEPENQFS
jgi:hypothetical protein